MNIKKVEADGVDIAILGGNQIAIGDVQSALDLMATVHYETGCDRMVINKSLISEPFFDLKTHLAGEILQKFVNYRMKLAVVGDFSGYESKSFKGFYL